MKGTRVAPPWPMRAWGAVLLLALASCGGAPDKVSEPMNWKAPGSWVLFSYWDPQCTYCQEEVPQLNAWHAQGLVRVFGVPAVRLSAEQKRRWQEKNQPIYPLLAQTPETLQDKLHVQVVPTHYLLSPEGKVHGPWVGVLEADTLAQVMGSAFN